MYETSKSKAIWGELEFSVLQGKGIDIGCGPDPVLPSAKRFDRKQGDANHVTRFVTGPFDYVYSSHCLEHMQDPVSALAEWWQLVKPGGHLFFTVPDEDLYEQGFYPGVFSRYHKSTFTIHKEKSWSPVSHNVRELAAGLPGGEVISIVLQDYGYDRNLLIPNRPRPSWLVHQAYYVYLFLFYYLGPKWTFLDKLIIKFHPIDQTMRHKTLAQIQCIVKKRL